MSSLSSSFLHLESEDHTVLKEQSFVLSSFDVIHVVVDLYVKDHNGKVHMYHPICQDRIQSLITDIQNCPFVQEPLCLKMNDEEVDPKTPVWNLLSQSTEQLDLQTEVVG